MRANCQLLELLLLSGGAGALGRSQKQQSRDPKRGHSLAPKRYEQAPALRQVA